MTKGDLLGASAMVLALAAPASAFAQERAAATAQATQDEGYVSANEIIVTATRRNETVQDVPVAITAISPQLLENAGVDNVRDLEQLAPSLQSSTGQSSATGTTIYLRGITTGGDNPGFEPAVGVFIDGVFRSRSGVAISELPELERVEILRGPQGTLFGRNTSAGALSIFTAQPQFETGGYAEAGYGNYNAYEARGALTGPVSETVALRLDGAYRKRDGYLKDANSDRSVNDINRWLVRGQALFRNGPVSVRLIADYYETDEQCCGVVSAARGPLAPVIQGIAAAQGLVGLYTGSTDDRVQAMSPNRTYGEKIRDYGFSGELNYDLGGAKLTSITAYRRWRVLRSQDIDFSGIDRAYRDGYRNALSDFTQEVRLQGSAFGSRLDWLVGAFYLNETNTLRDTVRVGNDSNRYVDSVFSAQLRPLFGTPVQFYGSLGAAVPTFGQVLLNPAAPPAAYGQLAPLVRLFRAQAGTAPIAGVAVVPGLAALALQPLPGNVSGQGNNNDDFRVKTNAFALFTHNIVHVTNKLSVTLGARWNHESKDLTATIASNTGACTFFNQARAGNAAAAAYANILRQVPGLFSNLFLLSCNPAVNSEFNGSYADKRSEDQLTGTVKLAYKFSPRILGYASYDRGYKSGGYNLDQATFDSALLGGNGAQAGDLHFSKETVDAFELGLKTQVSRKFTLNLAGFYSKFYNLQSLVFSGTNFVVQNVPKTTSKGVEAEATIQPERDLIFQLGYSYIDARYDDDGRNFAGTPLQGKGNLQLDNQPRHTVTIAGTWTPPIAKGINGLLHVDMRYNSEVNIPSSPPDANGRNALYNQGYPLISAAIGVQSPDGRRSLQFWVQNLTNQHYFISGFGVPEQNGNYAGYPGTPRFYGVRAKFGF
ncbi:TonB-dependent receptor [Sphingomonas sp. TDK1]|uniref:TonB-dependent receptor n=1 Tax=Sphingomonas sp. TDK1 TaxID=453247 RepID=UPI000B0BBD30|nr:TonB-dependent receptor [Sphingomonas sp. TDK1]